MALNGTLRTAIRLRMAVGVAMCCVPCALAIVLGSLAEADFFSTKTEDRYPDVFGLARADTATCGHARAIVRERLACLPHYAVTLGHDVTANIDVLSKIVASV